MRSCFQAHRYRMDREVEVFTGARDDVLRPAAAEFQIAARTLYLDHTTVLANNLNHEWGVRHPIGGSGSFTQALAACVQAHGGAVKTNSPVREILVENGQARGIALQSGEEIRARNVVGAVDPTTLMSKLVDQAHVSQVCKEEIRGLQSLRNNLYTFKIDAALSRRPTYPNHKLDNPHAVAAPMVCPSLAFLRRSTAKAMAGDFDHEIALQMAVPSIDDRTLVPEGSTGDSFYLYAFNTPVKLSDDREWSVEDKRYIEACLDQFEQYSPGFKDSIIDLHVTDPDDFESRYHVHKGNYEHADVTLAQMGPWRPVPSLAGYTTPVDNLYHSASGAFPMSFISGWPGRNTANMLLRGPSPLQRARCLTGRR